MTGPLITADPGANGGLAWGDAESPLGIRKFPETEHDLRDLLVEIQSLWPGVRVPVVIEDNTGFMSGSTGAAASRFRFGENTGVLKGLLIALNFVVHYTRPSAWQRGARIKRKKSSFLGNQTKWKAYLKSEAQRLFPEHSKKITLATSDAVLIYRHARQPDFLP